MRKSNQVKKSNGIDNVETSLNGVFESKRYSRVNQGNVAEEYLYSEQSYSSINNGNHFNDSIKRNSHPLLYNPKAPQPNKNLNRDRNSILLKHSTVQQDENSYFKEREQVQKTSEYNNSSIKQITRNKVNDKLNLKEYMTEFPLNLVLPNYTHTLKKFDVNQLFTYSRSLITGKELDVKDNLGVVPISVLGGPKIGKTTFVKYLTQGSYNEIPNSKDFEIIQSLKFEKEVYNELGIKVYSHPKRYDKLGGGPLVLECQSLASFNTMLYLYKNKDHQHKHMTSNQILSFREAQLLAFTSSVSKYVLLFLDGSQEDIDLSVLIDFIQEHNKKALWWKDYKNSQPFTEQQSNSELQQFLSCRKSLIIVVSKFTPSFSNINKRMGLEAKILDLLAALNHNKQTVDSHVEFEYTGLNLDPNLRGNINLLIKKNLVNILNIIYLPDFNEKDGFLNYHLSILRLRKLILNPGLNEVDKRKKGTNYNSNVLIMNERKWLAYSYLLWESILSNQDSLFRSY
ncbi:hypothetical protein K502DRAFT_364447 [Neoconidiobolus thromboides FSU 785]|nr:hypothetical protein K502DRAFT_364447 [Neoconidiobolus thromboides FSU 785]